MSTFSAEELAMLTPEELADLELDHHDDNDNGEGGDGKDGGKDNANTGAGGGDGSGADDSANESESDKAARLAAEQLAADAAGRDDGADAGAADAPRFKVDNVPLIRAGDTSGAEAKLAELETSRTALAELFESGDKTTAEFMSELRLLEREEQDVKWSLQRAELANEMSEAQKEQQWYTSVGVFLEANPEISASPLKTQAYDYCLRVITGDKANEGKSDVELLTMAKEQWAEQLGITLAKKTPTAVELAAAEVAAEGKKPGKPFKAPASPVTIGGLPSAEAQGTEDGKYAALDRLADTDPIRFEETMGKMSPSELEAYLQSN